MGLTPHQTREVLFHLLFAQDQSGTGGDELRELLSEQLHIPAAGVDEGMKRLASLTPHLPHLDERITAYAKDYTVERIPSVERNLLRLALFELLIEQTTPPKVILAEAIRLTRKFATPSAGTFVNGVLNAAHQARVLSLSV